MLGRALKNGRRNLDVVYFCAFYLRNDFISAECRLVGCVDVRPVGPVNTDVSNELFASFFRVGKCTRVRKSVRRLLTDGQFLQNVACYKTHTAPHPN
jgi:hypothetical protein